jgi:universal stress protein A
MKKYKHALIAIDVSNETNALLQQAKQITQAFNCTLSVIHVCEPIPAVLGEYLTLELPIGTKTLQDHVKNRLCKLTQDQGIPAEDVHILHGRTAEEVVTYANNYQVDLIITGSHTHRGLQRLLGSTANEILHKANCDVMTLKIAELH